MATRRVSAAALLALLVPSLAAAQAPGETVPIQPSAPMPGGDTKDPDTALLWSLGTSAAGFGMVLLGSELSHNSSSGSGDTIGTIGGIIFTIGPTTGHIYAGHTWNTGLGMRLAGSGLVFGGLLVALSACGIFESCSQQQQADANVGVAIMVGGALLYGAGYVYEIATAPAAARAYNRDHARATGGLVVGPLHTRDTTGIALGGTF